MRDAHTLSTLPFDHRVPQVNASRHLSLVEVCRRHCCLSCTTPASAPIEPIRDYLLRL
jgi:hypothetical protein